MFVESWWDLLNFLKKYRLYSCTFVDKYLEEHVAKYKRKFSEKLQI